MLCRLITLVVLAAWLEAPALAQQPTNATVPPPANSATQTPAPDDAGKPQSTDQNAQPKKQQSKVVRKLGEAIPDCANLLIIHPCRSSNGQQEKIEEQQAERRAKAAERCKQINAAKTRPTEPKQTVAQGESSSKAAPVEGMSPTECRPEDILEAEHDVEVGDGYFATKNYRGAEMRYRDALQALPGDPTAKVRLARVLEKTGRKDEALELYKAVLTASPDGKEAEEAKVAMQKIQKASK
jgi:TolA-binding protein